MQIIRIRMLEGPNIWSRQRMLEVELSQTPTCRDSLDLAVGRLSIRWDEADSILAQSDFPAFAWPLAPIDDADVLRILMLNLQRRVGLSVCETAVKQNNNAMGITRLAVEIVEEAAGRSAWQLACDLWKAAQRDDAFDLVAKLEQFKDIAFEACLGQTTGAIVSAAQARGIPTLRLDDVSLVQLGQGSRQRRLQTAISDRSGYIAEAVSRDKALTKSLLKRVGLPVPHGRPVRDIDDAWIAACEVGLPVVVKPRDADYGQGVSLKLTSRAEIAAAYQAARQYSENVVIEQFLEGDHHRLMIVGGEVIAAVRFGRAVVVGDGEQTVAQLIDEMNRDPRRGSRNDRTCPWFWMEVDDETRRVLASQGSGLEQTPPLGERIILRFEPRIGWGGGVFDVTDDVHPDLAATVVDAVKIVGLDIAGVDIIANDISRPLAEQNGGILEVNAGPAILMHLQPFSNPPRPVPDSIVSFLFDHPDESRIPIVGVCGNDDHATITNRIAELLRYRHTTIGQVTRTGVYLNERGLLSGRTSAIRDSQIPLLHPSVDAAVIDVALDDICEQGLAFDQCRVAIVLGMEARSFEDQTSNEDLRAALQVLLDSAQPGGTTIINVDDPSIAEVALRCGPGVIAISQGACHPTLERVNQIGGRRVFLRDDVVILAHGSHESPLFPLGRPDPRGAIGPEALLAMLATIATGWALGIPTERLRQEIPATSSIPARKRFALIG